LRRQEALTTAFSMVCWIPLNPWIILRTDRREKSDGRAKVAHGLRRTAALCHSWRQRRLKLSLPNHR
jgi:hypothetical protein